MLFLSLRAYEVLLKIDLAAVTSVSTTGSICKWGFML